MAESLEGSLIEAVIVEDGEEVAQLMSSMTLYEMQKLEAVVDFMTGLIGRILAENHPEGRNRGYYKVQFDVPKIRVRNL